MEKMFVSMGEAAELLCVECADVETLVADGKVKGITVNGKMRVAVRSLEALADCGSGEENLSNCLDKGQSSELSYNKKSKIDELYISEKEAEVLGKGSVVYVKKANSYIAQIDVGRNESGKRLRWSSRCCKTEAEAAGLLRKKRLELGFEVDDNDKVVIRNDSVLLEKLIINYIDFKYFNHRNTNSTRANDFNTAKIIIAAIGNTPIKSLTTDSVIKFFCEVESKHSQSYCDKVYNLLKGALNYAVAIDLLAKSPMVPIRKPVSEIERKEKEALNPDEIRYILRCAKEYKYKNVFFYLAVLLYTGVRRGEACSLRWDDFDYNNKTVNIDDSASVNFEGQTYYTHVKQTHINSRPKTKSSVRIIPVESDLFFEITRQWHMYCKAVYPKTCGEFVFPTERSEQVTPNGLSQRLADFVKFYGLGNLKSVTSHIMRHTIASIAYENNPNELAVSRFLGHSNTSVTQRYIHTNADATRQAVKKAHAELDEIIMSL